MGIALASVACLGLLQFLLAFNVSLNRMSSKRSHGCSDDPDDPLYRAVVGHRNTCEYGPIFSVLLLCSAWSAPGWALYLGPTVVIVRTVHALSIVFLSLRRPNLWRRLAAGLTYTLGVLLSGLVLYSSFTGMR